jgi:c-di-GMP-binding flagellar brake protein YcgR
MDREALGSIREKTPYDIQIVVDNVLYNWTDVLANVENEQGRDVCHLVVKTTPVIANRRKYPRMPIANSCTITRKDTDKTYRGKMVNVSANGFAFAAASDDFAELKGTQLILDIPDFPVKEERTMEGVVIRSTDNHGEYIVGCRMPEDSPAIQKYVNDNYKE